MTARLISSGIWRFLISAIVALVLVATLGATSVSAATNGCSVKNKATGRTYSTLQAAVNAARPKATLLVRGTCKGGTVISRSLTITGAKTKRTGIPTLTGAHRHRVLNIRRHVTVRLTGLQVIRGRAIRGAGIWNTGTLVLRDVIVRRNDTGEFGRGSGIWGGAGIWNTGRLELYGTTRITDNWTYGWGAGVVNAGSLSMNGASLISRNDPAYGLPGGIYNRPGAYMSMWDTSSVRLNGGWQVDNAGALSMYDSSWIKPEPSGEDVFGAGVRNYGRLSMKGASAIRDGRASSSGVENHGRLVMTETSSIRNNPGGGVRNLREGRRVGLVTMRDHSSIRDNTAVCVGAGIYNEGTFRMTDASTVTGNALTDPEWADCYLHGGGGVYQAGGSLFGVTCAAAPNTNVYGNTPDDCSITE